MIFVLLMKNPTPAFAVLLSLALVSSGLAENWPSWRGPRNDGTSLEKDVPVRWSATENVLWKTPLPGLGHASPIVWEERVFTVSCVEETEERVLLCMDRDSGRILWQKAVLKSPLERKHRLNSQASSTPATDGDLVYVAFLDAQEMVVAAYDFQGEQRWMARPGSFASVHGFCSSPLVHGDLVIVNGDHDGQSYLVGLDRRTGKTVWKTPREHHTRSYCVPIIRELSGRTQMILSGDKSVASYDPGTGKLHWIMDGPTEQFVASIVYNPKADLLFMTGGFPEHHLLGLKHDGTGKIGADKILWRHNRASMVSYVPSPISEGDYFLVVSDPGYANCLEASTGAPLWSEKLGSHHASLVSAGGLVYFLSDAGTTTVVKPGSTYEAVAVNALGEGCFASPAISQGKIFLRADRHLYCIGTRR